MGEHDNATRFDSMVGIDYVPAVSDEVGGDVMSMHGSMHQDAADPMDYGHESIIRLTFLSTRFSFQDVHILCFLLSPELSFECFRNMMSCAIGGHASRDISENRDVNQTPFKIIKRDVNQTIEFDILEDGHLRRNLHIRFIFL
jgi:hypothetical protein